MIGTNLLLVSLGKGLPTEFHDVTADCQSVVGLEINARQNPDTHSRIVFRRKEFGVEFVHETS